MIWIVPIINNITPNIFLRRYGLIKFKIKLPTIAPEMPIIANKIACFHTISFRFWCKISATIEMGMKNNKFIPWDKVCGKFLNNVKYIIRKLPPPNPIAAKIPAKVAIILDVKRFTLKAAVKLPK